MTRLVRLLLACSALAACTGPHGSGPELPPPPGSPPSRATTDCGTFTLSQGEEFPAAAAQCLISAAKQGLPARLVVTRPTVEGDPIPETYTARDGRVEVVTDTRQDGFGAKRITYQTCTGPQLMKGGIIFASCTEPSPVPS
jgi:hypothetical protein